MSIMTFGQMRVVPQVDNKTPEKHTHKLLAFVDANMGKKVGGGYCFDLIVSAQNDIHWHNDKWGKRAFHMKASPKPGDIMEFIDVIYVDGQGVTHRAPSHVGIVYEVRGNGEITYADNGFNHVVTLNDMNYKKIKKGKIRFYRM
jgi:hypothetical protein